LQSKEVFYQHHLARCIPVQEMSTSSSVPGNGGETPWVEEPAENVTLADLEASLEDLMSTKGCKISTSPVAVGGGAVVSATGHDPMDVQQSHYGSVMAPAAMQAAPPLQAAAAAPPRAAAAVEALAEQLEWVTVEAQPQDPVDKGPNDVEAATAWDTDMANRLMVSVRKSYVVYVP
jgi:hypothetical protein